MSQKTALARTNTTRGEPDARRRRGFVNVLTRQSELQGEGLFCQLPSAIPLIQRQCIGFKIRSESHERRH
jgi:hypothetical protein